MKTYLTTFIENKSDAKNKNKSKRKQSLAFLKRSQKLANFESSIIVIIIAQWFANNNFLR